jgi:nucleotide-binding universal stress UspA family protein
MTLIKQILVPIDFSETSARALEFGRLLADACNASLHLLHVIGYPLTDLQALRQDRHDALRRLDSLLDRADREIRQARASCEVGAPANAIVAYADENAIDLIVMGTHWHGPTAQMATGSIAEAVLGLAPCAVLAVKGAKVHGREPAFDPIPRAARTA